MRKTCKICGRPTTKPKYCSDKCQKKAWKLYNRERYLVGKRAYREKNKKKILKYKEMWKVANPEKVKEHNKNYKERRKHDSQKRSD